ADSTAASTGDTTASCSISKLISAHATRTNQARDLGASSARGVFMEGRVSRAAERFQVKESVGSHFAWLNARMALEMTMMSWIRMAITLIGFGFTIVQFFERLNEMEGVAPAARPFAARYVGLLLIAAGVGALIVSVMQYRATI